MDADHNSRTDSHVRQFYSSGGGDRMFSDDLFTPAVNEYLTNEQKYVLELFEELKPNHLFEVGCGYGRYLSWAENQGVDYDGVDLVSHLVEAGRKRLTGSPRTRQKLHVGSCREVAALFDSEGLLGRSNQVVVLFPFNCFGNVAEPEAVVRSLYSTGARVLVSGFLSTQEATEQRQQYYLKSGFTQLATTQHRRGVLCTSSEGLHSYAFETPVLERLFAASNFKLTRRQSLGTIAQALLFEAQPK